MGAAFIIPGFSGGSVAAILGIYEKLVGAVAGLLTSFKKSFVTLLRIMLGLVVGALSLLFPLEWALGKIPFQTVSLFVGLTIGCMPSLTAHTQGRVRWCHIFALIIPLLITLSLSILPSGADRDLMSLNLFGYAILFLVGILGSSALVIPGISGRMLLLMLGYYNPIVSMITGFIKSVFSLISGGEVTSDEILRPILVIGSVGLGIAVGFIGISVIMKKLFEVAKRGTYFAIIGFIIGSLPTVFITTAKDSGYTLSTLPNSAAFWIVCLVALLLGAAISYSLVIFSRKKSN
jgi:putative membrane protein